VVALCAFGCGAASVGMRADGARLVDLPRVPSPQVTIFPPSLRGLSFRVNAHFDGAAPDDPAMASLADKCVSNFEGWMGAAGWKPVRDASADLVIEEHCAARMQIERRGDVFEFRRPADETIAVVVAHDGVPIVTVQRGPTDYVCESNAPREQMKKDCTTRAEKWGQANIVDALITSAPIAELARRLAAERHAP
jgi:hypothetical protein